MSCKEDNFFFLIQFLSYNNEPYFWNNIKKKINRKKLEENKLTHYPVV